MSKRPTLADLNGLNIIGGTDSLRASIAEKNKRVDAQERSQRRAAKRQAKEEADRYFAKICIQVGLPTPIAEHKFHKPQKGEKQRHWRIDYFFRRGNLRVGLEVEGGVHTGGRHTRGAGFEEDIVKYNTATIQGIPILRTTPAKLYTHGIPDVVAWFGERQKATSL